jgi:Lar family restriction alleviation protein
MPDLLPCPFCGAAAERGDAPADIDDANAGGSYIQCTECAASTALFFDRKEHLFSSWNQRVYFNRDNLARHLAALDGIRLHDIRSTVGPAEDANNWREYLGRADDLLALISAFASPLPLVTAPMEDEHG